MSCCLHTSRAQTPTINRVSGCTDTGDITIECPRFVDVLLTIHGSDFLALGSMNSYSIRFSQDKNLVNNRISTMTNTTFTAIFRPLNGDFLNTDLFNISLWYTPFAGSAYAVASFMGMSLVAPIPFTVSSIFGCPTIDRFTASDCNFTAPLTIIGTGFSVMRYSSIRVTLGSMQSTRVEWSSGLFQIVDDSHILMFMADSGLSIPAEAFAGTIMPLTLISEGASWNITWFSIGYSLTSFPPVAISNMLATKCTSESLDGRTRFNTCYPGTSILSFAGKYFWSDTQVWIGGRLAEISRDSTTTFVRVSPMIANYELNIYHDVRIVNRASDVTITGLMSFVTTPQVVGFSPCVKKFVQDASSGDCLQGELFQISVVNLQGRAAPRVWFGNDPCADAHITSDLTVQCTITRDPDGTSSVARGLFVNWPDHNSTNFRTISLWDHPYAPRIAKAEGPSCSQSSDLTKPLQCLLNNTSSFTITTTKLNETMAWGAQLAYRLPNQLNSQKQTVPCVGSTTVGKQVTCELGFRVNDLDPSLVYDIEVFSTANPSIVSNVLSVQFVQQLDGQSGSSSSKDVAIAVGVVIPLLVIVVAVIIFLKCRHQRPDKSDPIITSGWDSSSLRKNIEMA